MRHRTPAHRRELNNSWRGSPERRAPRHAGFTLLELMMAIVILGLGLVMVATMFPVAWTRARTMSETTARQTIVPTTESTLRGLVPVADASLTQGGFAGDLVYVGDCSPGWIAAYSDTRVHALNMQNVRVGGGGKMRGFVAEDPWMQEMIPDANVWIRGVLVSDDDLNNACKELFAGPDGISGSSDDPSESDLADAFAAQSYQTPRVTFGQR